MNLEKSSIIFQKEKIKSILKGNSPLKFYKTMSRFDIIGKYKYFLLMIELPVTKVNFHYNNKKII